MKKFSTTEPTVNKVIRFPKSLNDKLDDLKSKHRCSFQQEVITGLERYVEVLEEEKHYDQLHTAETAEEGVL